MKYSSGHTVYRNAQGNEVPSVTTILQILNKPSLQKWANIMGFQRRNTDEILKESARIGTMVHGALHAYLMNSLYVFIGHLGDKLRLVQFLDGFITWSHGHTIEPIFMEEQIISDRYAGTCDFYGMIDGKHTIMDFKTSKQYYITMFLQLAAYCRILEEQGKQVDQVCIVLVHEGKSKSRFITRNELQPYIETFEKLVALFHDYFDLSIDNGWGPITK